MVASTEVKEVKKRRVMSRDHDDIAQYIHSELKAREGSKWRKKHEDRWREIDRQMEMEPPAVIGNKGEPDNVGDWHNAIQLGDLSDAAETLVADYLRLLFPTERKWFVPHVELPTDMDDEGNQLPVPPAEQRTVNGVLRNLMVQQHKDFGVRGRFKLAIYEMLAHGSVTAVVEQHKLNRYIGGTKPEHLKAPVPVVHSMWNCFPDPSPSIQGTEVFYNGSMIIRSWKPLKDALNMPGWINKDKLQENNKSKETSQEIEIITYYGDIFLKRHDGNIFFPNRKTIVNEHVFLSSELYDTDVSPVIYTGYQRADVRDPYYSSAIEKRAGMAFFATHMANGTMDAVDLKNKPPINYDSLDNSHKGAGPQIFPGARIPSRGGTGISTLDVGDPSVGLAATQWAKEQLQEGTAVDATRKGVAPGTEQTATEVVKTEQRSEVRTVEGVSELETGMAVPYLILQHSLNLIHLRDYPFFNDEPHTPDFLRASKKDLPKNVIMEVTGSRTLLGEEQRTARFMNAVGIVASLEPVAQKSDWDEITRQIWEDTRVKDPERFLKDGDRNEEVESALEQQKAQFQELVQQLQEQMAQLQQQAQQAQDAQRKAEFASQEASLQQEKQKLREERLQLEKDALREQLKLTNELNRAEDRLQKLEQSIKEEQIRAQCKKDDGERKEIVGLAKALVQ